MVKMEGIWQNFMTAHKSIDPTIDKEIVRILDNIETLYSDRTWHEIRQEATAQIKDLISKKVIEARIDELKIFEQHLVDKYEIPPDHPQLHPYFETRTNILKQQLKGEGEGKTSHITEREEKV